MLYLRRVFLLLSAPTLILVGVLISTGTGSASPPLQVSLTPSPTLTPLPDCPIPSSRDRSKSLSDSFLEDCSHCLEKEPTSEYISYSATQTPVVEYDTISLSDTVNRNFVFGCVETSYAIEVFNPQPLPVVGVIFEQVVYSTPVYPVYTSDNTFNSVPSFFSMYDKVLVQNGLNCVGVPDVCEQYGITPLTNKVNVIESGSFALQFVNNFSGDVGCGTSFEIVIKNFIYGSLGDLQVTPTFTPTLEPTSNAACNGFDWCESYDFTQTSSGWELFGFAWLDGVGLVHSESDPLFAGAMANIDNDCMASGCSFSINQLTIDAEIPTSCNLTPENASYSVFQFGLDSSYGSLPLLSDFVGGGLETWSGSIAFDYPPSLDSGWFDWFSLYLYGECEIQDAITIRQFDVAGYGSNPFVPFADYIGTVTPTPLPTQTLTPTVTPTFEPVQHTGLHLMGTNGSYPLTSCSMIDENDGPYYCGSTVGLGRNDDRSWAFLRTFYNFQETVQFDHLTFNGYQASYVSCTSNHFIVDIHVNSSSGGESGVLSYRYLTCNEDNVYSVDLGGFQGQYLVITIRSVDSDKGIHANIYNLYLDYTTFDIPPTQVPTSTPTQTPTLDLTSITATPTQTPTLDSTSITATPSGVSCEWDYKPLSEDGSDYTDWLNVDIRSGSCLPVIPDLLDGVEPMYLCIDYVSIPVFNVFGFTFGLEMFLFLPMVWVMKRFLSL